MVLEVKLMDVGRRDAFIQRELAGGRVEYLRMTVDPFETILIRDNESLLFPTPGTRPCTCGMTLNPFHGCTGEIPLSITTLVRLAIAAAAKFRGRPTPELVALRAAVDKMRDEGTPWGDL